MPGIQRETRCSLREKKEKVKKAEVSSVMDLFTKLYRSIGREPQLKAEESQRYISYL